MLSPSIHTHPPLVVLWAESFSKFRKTGLTSTNLDHRVKVTYCLDCAGRTVGRSINWVTRVETSSWKIVLHCKMFFKLSILLTATFPSSSPICLLSLVITREISPPFSSSIPQNIEGQSYITNSKVLKEILGYVVIKEVIFFGIICPMLKGLIVCR